MFTIRAGQIEAFSEGQLEQLRVRLYRHLERFFPETLPSAGPEWDHLFGKGMRDARRFSLDREVNITIYFNIMLSIGPDFSTTQAWAQPILSDRRLHENEKMRRLIQHTEVLLEAADKEKPIAS